MIPAKGMSSKTVRYLIKGTSQPSAGTDPPTLYTHDDTPARKFKSTKGGESIVQTLVYPVLSIQKVCSMIQ